MSAGTAKEVVLKYIRATHGGLIGYQQNEVEKLLCEDLKFENECETHSRADLLNVFTHWSMIVKQEKTNDNRYNKVIIDHLIQEPESVVVSASWRTFYTTKDKATYYDNDVSNISVENFRVLAFFTCKLCNSITEEGQSNKEYKIVHILQRSDSARSHLLSNK